MRRVRPAVLAHSGEEDLTPWTYVCMHKRGTLIQYHAFFKQLHCTAHDTSDITLRRWLDGSLRISYPRARTSDRYCIGLRLDELLDSGNSYIKRHSNLQQSYHQGGT